MKQPEHDFTTVDLVLNLHEAASTTTTDAPVSTAVEMDNEEGGDNVSEIDEGVEADEVPTALSGTDESDSEDGQDRSESTEQESNG